MAYAQAEHEIGYVVFEHTTLEPIPSTQIPKPDAIVDTVSCALARGEYEPIQIGVHALADGLTNIRVTVESDLKVTVYHHINPGIKQQLVSEPGTVVVSEVPGEVYLQRGDVVGQLAAGHSVNFGFCSVLILRHLPAYIRGRCALSRTGGRRRSWT